MPTQKTSKSKTAASKASTPKKKPSAKAKVLSTANAPKAAATKSKVEVKTVAATAKIPNSKNSGEKTPKSKAEMAATSSVPGVPLKSPKKSGAKSTPAYEPRNTFDHTEEPDADEALEAEAELEELPEEEETTEGPPPWWKVDPAAIEGADAEEDSGADFDDSDEWTEDDEDWSTTNRRESFDDIDESSEDEEGRW